ncbi:hypothetical protein, partial [Lysinibacillus agricola]|uniref:hypothetical protein n=1 Tax=Lysinibacillus agricola TaxID=2590012 RepID=UPI003C25952B
SAPSTVAPGSPERAPQAGGRARASQLSLLHLLQREGKMSESSSKSSLGYIFFPSQESFFFNNFHVIKVNKKAE